jgi:DNA-binding response OmpR family regulator
VGCDGFVTKPCLPDDLVNKVRAFLGPGKSESVKKRKR